MVPPHGDAWGRVTAVDMARRLAADAFFMKGHMAFDWRRTESMVEAARNYRYVAFGEGYAEVMGGQFRGRILPTTVSK
jgi:hypothetical protein